METRVIVGLGNPGAVYEKTRHNVGFDVVEEVCRAQKLRLKSGSGEYFFCETSIRDVRVLIVKPMTYMNNSGEAVVDALHRLGGMRNETLVVVDDFALPLGTLRLRTKGSDGGHNGLRSIIYELRSDDFPRLRCGIGPAVLPSKEKIAEFVLSPFADTERVNVHNMVLRAADSCIEFAAFGLARAMNRLQHIQ